MGKCAVLLVNMMWKYCLCLVLVQAKLHQSERKIHGFDLLKNLPFSTNRHQIEKLSTKGWRFKDANSGDITYINLSKSLRKRTKEVTTEFIGYSGKKTLTTLFGVYLKHKPLPLFEISLHINKRKLILRYQGKKSFQRSTLTFGEELEKWAVLSVSVNRTHFTGRVGCSVERSVQLTQKMKRLPKRAVGILASGKKGENKFTGELLEARLYPRSMKKRLLLCAQPVEFEPEQGYMRDAPVNGDRILLLEQQIVQLNKMVEMLKLQNSNLTTRVTELEACGECDQGCEWKGQVFDEGETWNQDKCTVCICRNSKSDCLQRTDIPSCQTPCSTNLCQNNGDCISYTDEVTVDDFQCQCKAPYDGQFCEIKENPCVWPRESGICDQIIPRFYYNMEMQECLPFNYSGCGGNINNYETLEDCKAVAVKGACCYRQYSLKVEDVIVSSQGEVFGCKEITLSECQSTHRQVVGDMEMEVISFYPGVTCQVAGCGRAEAVCKIDDRKYEVGEKAVLGCQECTCESSGQFVCSCSQKTVRKEIRDMTASELAQFQAAIQQLRLVGPENPWEEFRDIYMRHTMHSNGGPYFLPWHRVFLRKLEQRLQQIDCDITLPYYDFSTDVGDFANAIIWQPNYFGGNGVQGCVLDHPFGLPGSWRPCINRNFNTDVKLPTLLELSLALASEDYTEMSMCLESFVSYIHTYIGGDMATRAASYDPVFYPLHAYIDMLYWWWQNKGSNKFKYPAAFGNIPMVPFNVPPSAILDLESDLCVTYLAPAKGNPCNRTSDKSNGRDDKMRGDVTPEGDITFEGGFNSLGYDKKGFDRRGFDNKGYTKLGINRDGFNRDGFDEEGFNRYGYNKSGFDRYGYDNEGFNREIIQDTTGRYNAYGLNINCLDRRGLTTEGYDRYGFNMNGYDVNHCNYFFNGPFATIQSRKVWDILLLQSKEFIMSLTRTCPGLKPLPTNWLQQYWITDIKDVTDLIPVQEGSQSMIKNSRRFCFDLDAFVIPCGCDVGVVSCKENPCLTMACPSYPEASCRVDFCGTCKPRWYLNGEEIDCFEERDFCEPNPCENDGKCVASIWPSEPQLTTCECPPGFDGHYCQYEALDVCELPRSVGSCSNRETRWYFDAVSQTCESFVYSGCGGNSNNFPSRGSCEARCKIGACCYRYPKNSEAVIGYDLQIFDMYGFNIPGNSRRGDVRVEDNGIKTGRDRFGSSRYDWQGYDRSGYNRAGYDRFGLDKSGYTREGFNMTGYNQAGEYDGIIDYNSEGYDQEGYNRVGFTCHGTDRDGLNAFDVYAEYVYRCRSATLLQCQRVEEDPGRQVVKFTRGRRCEDVKCDDHCGCSYNDKTYQFGETFQAGCQFCTCTLTGSVECVCPKIYRRKEIRDLSREELEKYQDAVKQLIKKEYPSAWYSNAQMYADHRPQAIGTPASLPWHRKFLRVVERQLQEIDCSITIPYYDWTVNAGDQHKSVVWASNIFGGTGSGPIGCVDHHPFKDYYPPYWIPCLRREFNSSVQLPDIVDMQYALNENDYERFRLSMEVYMDIFKSWVGGHMDSEYSPYDPLFFSVAAFIDRIWWDWETKNGLLKYPQHLRYVPMMPFKTAPDDVMDSKKQMCVTYFPLTEGAACNVTLSNLNYNSLGYDRHGFDREGYDIEGYNVYGLDRDGNTDDRGIYNVHGYDREGFKRNGYDSMGLDRFGFYTDNFNVDGFDSTGYDRSGYDRYGFDRSGKTPFGFQRNDSLVNALPDTYDSYSYNRFGLNAYGLDRQGYDVFGFDTTGYDRRKCNRYFLGPMLVIVKRWAEIELNRADNKTIRVITRICPALNTLPQWRYTLNWMKRGNQVALIEGILGRAQERALGEHPTPRDSSVTETSLWLPVGPDRNLCFVTYYYTECPFGEFPVDCDDSLCRNKKCPGFPNAQCRINRCGKCEEEWYNGITGNAVECSGCIDREGIERAEGSSWPTSICENCDCTDGTVECVETICDPIRCTHPVEIPGRCCLSCEAGCDFEGALYENGQTFPSPTDSCSTCMCTGGSASCARSPCPDLGGCQSQTTLEGECCPTCLDCGSHASGDVWKEGACQDCTCVDGEKVCQRVRCIPPDCSHPALLPGECCPACDRCQVNGRLYESGTSYQQDQCTTCTCEEGTVRCNPIPCPVTTCLNPITPVGECCPTCDNECRYKNRVYRHGETFLSPDVSCTTCTCDNGVVQCAPVTCPRMNLPCRQPITLPGDCCPTTCPSCSADGFVYENGATWKSMSDPCETCVCEEGLTACQRIERCPRQCDHGVRARDQCCSNCTDCLYSGQRVRDGQTFVQPGDNCQQCMCLGGQVTCHSLGPCPGLSCRRRETPPGACCPQCIRCEHRGQMHTHGDIVYTDECSTCFCREGEIECDRVSCPPAPCSSPQDLPDHCCPVCLQCEYKGRIYEEEQRFTPLREPCHDCVCRAGEVTCMTRESECPLSRCTHPIKSTKQCCPICDGCSYLRRRFRNGQKFVPPGRDNCKVCRCVRGSIECSNMGCPPVNCNNAVLVKGQCCPVCPMGCNVMGIQYRDGQTFIDFMNRCQVCTCMMGQIRCMAMMSCPRITCTHPANRPGNCCPSCTMCEQTNVQYKNGQVFTSASNPCEECVCRDGSITCRPKSLSCPRPNCLDPVLDPDTCCPRCDTQPCLYSGRQYSEGQEVPASRGTCETCICSNGMIDCGPRKCPTVNCRHPGRDECCRTCEYCEYSNMKFELGELFPSPYAACEDCVCQAGSVACHRRRCPEPNCSNPTYTAGGCCPVCSGCTFQGILYQDGESFSNPSRPCETCHCMHGNVACDSRPCNKVSCRYPVLEDCCAVCTDCMYHHVRYQDGQTFASPYGCGQCQCVAGDVQCDSQLECPTVNCTHPIIRDCCPQCTHCMYQNHQYKNEQSFQDISNRCNTCTCNYGTVTCKLQPCPEVTCDTPTQGSCCMECDDCNFLGEPVGNGELVTGSFGPCEQCRCESGNIKCYSVDCPSVSCLHPIRGECCEECTDCLFDGQVYRNGRLFTTTIDPCLNCECTNGTIRCSTIQCAEAPCSNPSQVAGQCCPVCSSDCKYGDTTYRHGDKFADDGDSCSDCVCKTGQVQCVRRECPPRTCSHPIRSECCYSCDGCFYGNQEYADGERFKEDCNDCVCVGGTVQCSAPVCPPVSSVDPVTVGCCPRSSEGCMLEGKSYSEGDRVPDLRDPCKLCTCQNDTFNCELTACPPIICHHPTAGQCCPECHDCQIGARRISHGYKYQDVKDGCSTCVCQAGTISCKRRDCERGTCSHPVADVCGCPVCDQDCLYEGTAIQHGQTADDPTDKCSQCICQAGVVACRRKDCASCSHPVAEDACCPICSSCLYEGRIRKDGERFASHLNPCDQCLCLGGSVTCTSIQCPRAECDSPQAHPGECCAICSVCIHEDQVYDNGQTIQGTQLCQKCTCQSGSVKCSPTDCPILTCLQQETRPGECCSVCKGCTVNGMEHDDGDQWLSPDKPCITCTCTGGFVTCMERQCFTACDDAVILPGQCCPVCPSCVYEGVTYVDGESFSPSSDPCDVCDCKGGHLSCYHDTCPQLADCSIEQQRAPEPGSCCPTCAGLSTDCTQARFGEITHPRPDNTCFFCECQTSFRWECFWEQCPDRPCGRPTQETPGVCCPPCPGCFDNSTDQYHDEGDSWTHSNDSCRTCSCQGGTVECSSIDCMSLECHDGERPVHVPGTCCPVCQPSNVTGCLHDGSQKQEDEEWYRDACTACQCIEAVKVCSSRICPDLQCGPDGTLTALPRTCCPVCLPKPGICLVYGDPHYRTFDGSTVHFQGTCKYVMATDCRHQDFTVEVHHDDRGVRGVSWAQNFTFLAHGIRVDLLQNHTVMVNGTIMEPPYLLGSDVAIDRRDNNILVTSKHGVKLVWDGASYAELSVPGSYKRQMCGLCGNFNGFPQDDLRTQDGKITNSPAILGNSWKSVEQSSLTCSDASDTDPCVEAGYHVRRQASATCEVIRESRFSACHRLVSFEAYFSSCIYDLCACTDQSACLCDILTSYAKECAKSGVRLEWRSHDLCAMECDTASGFVFDECGPVCERTCDNWKTPLGDLTENCYKPCVAGCQCPADKVVHRGKCIRPDQCPNIHSNDG